MAKKNEVKQDFASVLLTHDKGKAHTDASNKMTDAVAAVMETGKVATVTVKIKISPIKDMPTGVKLESAVTTTLPKDPAKSIWFAGDDGTLHRNDPRQISMFDEATAQDEVVRHTPEETK